MRWITRKVNKIKGLFLLFDYEIDDVFVAF